MGDDSSGPDGQETENTVVDEVMADGEEVAVVRRRLAWWQKLLVGLGASIGVLGALALVLYFFGGMSKSAYDPQIEQAYQQMVAAGQVQPVEKRFVIGIPGCTCHSKDPYLTQQHRSRRMNQCQGCHGGAGPK